MFQRILLPPPRPPPTRRHRAHQIFRFDLCSFNFLRLSSGFLSCSMPRNATQPLPYSSDMNCVETKSVVRAPFPLQVGLGLSYALSITQTLSFGVRSSTALENQFISVERVQQFIGLPQEEEEVCEMGVGFRTRGRWHFSFGHRAIHSIRVLKCPCQAR